MNVFSNGKTFENIRTVHIIDLFIGWNWVGFGQFTSRKYPWDFRSTFSKAETTLFWLFDLSDTTFVKLVRVNKKNVWRVYHIYFGTAHEVPNSSTSPLGIHAAKNWSLQKLYFTNSKQQITYKFPVILHISPNIEKYFHVKFFIHCLFSYLYHRRIQNLVRNFC